MGGILAALPFVLLVAFALGGEPGGRNNTVSLMDTATASGANFAAVNLFVSAGFLLVIPVALFCGDTVASEAGWSSLRYLLAAPVPRARLLWSKLGLGLGLAAMILLPVVPAPRVRPAHHSTYHQSSLRCLRGAGHERAGTLGDRPHRMGHGLRADGDLATSALYPKFDFTALREVARPWPGQETA